MKGCLHWLRKINKPLRNEKGFVLPLTLVFTFLLFSFLLHQINMYQSEKVFIQQREASFALDRLVQIAVADTKRVFDTTQVPPSSDTFEYDGKGTATYEINSEYSSSTVRVIGLTVIANNKGEHFNWLYYDKDKKKFTRWEELN
jgi:hypothetical protein